MCCYLSLNMTQPPTAPPPFIYLIYLLFIYLFIVYLIYLSIYLLVYLYFTPFLQVQLLGTTQSVVLNNQVPVHSLLSTYCVP